MGDLSYDTILVRQFSDVKYSGSMRGNSFSESQQTVSGHRASSDARGAAVILFFVALIIRLASSRSIPLHYDEYFHLLAARSWAEDGSFRLFEGTYTRGWLYTMLAGVSYEIFGQPTAFAARLPAILAGAAMVPVLFLWLRRVVDRTAAWTAALLLCVAELAVRVSDFARFYSFQSLFVLVAAFLAYRFIVEPAWRTAWKPLLAAVCLLIAFLFQVTTVIAAGALGIFLLLYSLTQPWGQAILVDRRVRPWLLVAVVAGAVVAGLVVTSWAPVLFQAPTWAAKNQSNFIYYHIFLAVEYRLMWYLFPLAAVVAFARYPAPASFCLVMWLVPVLVHSLGGMKAARYISYAFPFFIALWGIAVASIASWLRGEILSLLARAEEITGLRLPERVRLALAGIALVAIGVPAAAANLGIVESTKDAVRAVVRAVRSPQMIADEPPNPPWTKALGALRRMIGRPEVLLTGDSFQTIYYFGGHDLWIAIPTARLLPSSSSGYGLDPRNGLPVAGDPATVERVIACHRDGFIMVPDYRWRRYAGVTDEVADVIEARTHAVRPSVPGFYLFRWRHAVPEAQCVRWRLPTRHLGMPVEER